jgi:hypothetical protein
LVWSFCYLVLRCVLQLAMLRPRSQDFQGARDRRAPTRARGASSAGRSTAAGADRSGLSCRGEPAATARELAVVLRYADDAAALTPAAHRQALGMRRLYRSTADRWRDPRVGVASGAREPALGLSADRRRATRARHHDLRDDRAEDPAPGWPRACRRTRGTLLARLRWLHGESRSRASRSSRVSYSFTMEDEGWSALRASRCRGGRRPGR